MKRTQLEDNLWFNFPIIRNAKAFDCVDHNKLWKILKDGNTGAPDLPLLRKKIYALMVTFKLPHLLSHH